MRLLVISHTPHYHRDGKLVGWGPTVRELDVLSHLFAELVHIAPLHNEPTPASALPYTSPAVRVKTVPAAGGSTFKDKLQILRLLPHYLQTIHAALAEADMVHVRCPANISLIAVLYLTLRGQPAKRWVKYAGNWQPKQPDPLSYRLQRWWLQHGWQGGVVTVNGRWPQQPAHIHTFYNPSLTQAEQESARQRGSQKRLGSPLNILFVGALNKAKGVSQVLQIAAQLKEHRISFALHLLGDGPERTNFEAESRALEIETAVTFHGWLPKDALAEYYARAHFILLPSRTEGWPKVLSEAIAYGVVPLASNVSAISQTLSKIGSGKAHSNQDVAAFVRSICDYLDAPERWQHDSLAGMQSAYRFTYEAYLQAVRKLVDEVS